MNSRHARHLRRLTLFAAAVAFGETCFFAVLAPLLPTLVDELGLSDVGAGVLSAGYPAGMAVATVPAGIVAARFGPRPTSRVGMGAVALSSVGFALGGSASVLVLSRFAQGAGAAVAWAGALAWIALRASPERRGSAMGATIGVAFAASLVAPLLALLAEHASRAAVFTPVAAAIGAVAVWGGPREPRPGPPNRDQARSLSLVPDASVRGALTVMLLIGVLLGLLQSLGPLVMSARGLTDGAIALVFLAAVGPQALLTPVLGRMVDRDGPVRITVASLLVLTLLLPLAAIPSDGAVTGALIALLTSLALGAVSPVMVWVSELSEAHGGQQGLAMAYSNGAWALGAAAGALLLTPTAGALGVAFSFGGTAVLCAAAAAWCSASRLTLEHSRQLR